MGRHHCVDSGPPVCGGKRGKRNGNRRWESWPRRWNLKSIAEANPVVTMSVNRACAAIKGTQSCRACREYKEKRIERDKPDGLNSISRSLVRVRCLSFLARKNKASRTKPRRLLQRLLQQYHVPAFPRGKYFRFWYCILIRGVGSLGRSREISLKCC